MTRSARFRSAAVLAAALFLLAGAERAFSYAHCPHHGVPTKGADPAHAGHHEDPTPADHSGPCTCLGECQAAGGGFVPATGSRNVVVTAPLTVAVASTVASAPLPRLAPHALPFATAPPPDR
ncbi:MAG TPA: hypothetical protein VFU41_04400 [Gemmatimonadales bacterium]|nr:hypothetical protein [Gemmatimonadales bacterium]